MLYHVLFFYFMCCFCTSFLSCCIMCWRPILTRCVFLPYVLFYCLMCRFPVSRAVLLYHMLCSTVCHPLFCFRRLSRCPVLSCISNRCSLALCVLQLHHVLVCCTICCSLLPLCYPAFPLYCSPFPYNILLFRVLLSCFMCYPAVPYAAVLSHMLSCCTVCYAVVLCIKIIIVLIH